MKIRNAEACCTCPLIRENKSPVVPRVQLLADMGYHFETLLESSFLMGDSVVLAITFLVSYDFKYREIIQSKQGFHESSIE